jgi:hypothetical protein
MTDQQYENPFAEDVEVPDAEAQAAEIAAGEVELEEVDVPEPGAPAEGKTEKQPKAPARPPVPEGYVTPVAFAKVLTEHLEAKGYENSKGPVTVASNPIPPQMVYSYLKNSGPGSKNEWPRYEEGGRKNLVKVEESLEWWDALIERVAASKQAAKAKADKKAAKAEETPTVEAEATPVEEAE